MFVFYTACVIIAVGRLSLADDPLVITKFSFKVSPKEDQIELRCTYNKETDTTLTRNDKQFSFATKNSREFIGILHSPAIDQYKCVPKSSKMVAVLDLNTNIKDLNHDIVEEISFVVDVLKKRASIEYKLKDNHHPLTCKRNNQEMIIESLEQGIKFVNELDIENNFTCNLQGSKEFAFAFSMKDEMPRISDIHVTVIPESRQVKILCQTRQGLEPGHLETMLVPQTTIIYNRGNEVMVNSTETNQAFYFHNIDSYPVYKCEVENKYGKESWVIEVNKIERKRLGDDGGILKFHLKPYSTVMKITSTFDIDQDFKCYFQGKEEIDSVARQWREEEIKTFTKKQGTSGIYECKAKNGDEITVRLDSSAHKATLGKIMPPNIFSPSFE